jgi:putative sigma-54 modulation protein
MASTEMGYRVPIAVVSAKAIAVNASKKENVMNITVSGHHVDVTDAMRQHVAEKFDKLQRHIDQIVHIEVTLIVEKVVHKAEANIHISGADLFATAESNDMYTAIDALAEKLDRQIIKHKEKHRGR